jgi:serine protease Do
MLSCCRDADITPLVSESPVGIASGAVRRVGQILLVLVLLSAAPTPAAPPTEEVFRRFADAVLQIRVTERESGAKAVVGSGFYADAGGRIVTNYHVIAKAVLYPDRYVVERIDRQGSAETVSLEAIDAVHDLAVVRGLSRARVVLSLAGAAPVQGARLYAMGNPLDLGLSIVEGTYNGLLQHSLYQRLHLTGALNPGMSGGPTLTERGALVGVNVRSAGEQVSFLVPATFVRGVLEQARRRPEPPPGWIDVVREQLLAHQEAYFATLLAVDPIPTVTMEGFVLPGKLAPFLRCWGDAQRDETDPYDVVGQECASDDYAFVSDRLLSGVVRYRHHVLTTTELNTFQMYALASEHFGAHYGSYFGDEEEVTAFVCRPRLVRHESVSMKAAVCLRGYRRMPGLYDAVLRVVVLGSGDRVAESAVALSGVSTATVEHVVRRYLGVIGRVP